MIVAVNHPPQSDVPSATPHAPIVLRHADEVLRSVPTLRVSSSLVSVAEPPADASVVDGVIAEHLRVALTRLEQEPESAWPLIAAWRRVLAAMGVRPTKHRCAAESLLRRLRTTGTLPRIHPVINVCNAVSARAGIPIAVFDLDRVQGPLVVRRSTGDETWEGFGGEAEHPAVGEINYIDEAAHAHSRRWCHRQSARSAVRPESRRLLVVAEAVHESAEESLSDLTEHLDAGLASIGAETGPWQEHQP